MSPAKPALAEIGGEASLTLEMVPVKFKDNLSSKNLCVQLRRPVILSNSDFSTTPNCFPYPKVALTFYLT